MILQISKTNFSSIFIILFARPFVLTSSRDVTLSFIDFLYVVSHLPLNTYEIVWYRLH